MLARRCSGALSTAFACVNVNGGRTTRTGVGTASIFDFDHTTALRPQGAGRARQPSGDASKEGLDRVNRVCQMSLHCLPVPYVFLRPQSTCCLSVSLLPLI
ncbi:protein of unknown function [Pararobbsia alpina]